VTVRSNLDHLVRFGDSNFLTFPFFSTTGSPMSTCRRHKSSNCLLYGHNDGRTKITGDALSGWIVFTLPELKEGLVFAKLEVRSISLS
jgi:hypothetical protein